MINRWIEWPCFGDDEGSVDIRPLVAIVHSSSTDILHSSVCYIYGSSAPCTPSSLPPMNYMHHMRLSKRELVTSRREVKGTVSAVSALE